MKKFYFRSSLLTLLLSGFAFGQVTLPSGGSYTENFDLIGTDLPNGWTVKTGTSNTSNGVNVTFNKAKFVWNNTTGAFKNFASANGLTASASTNVQNASTDRSLGVRQTGSFGTTNGTSFVFQIANTENKSNFKLNFKLQSLDSSSERITTWKVEYSVGNTLNFVALQTLPATLTTGDSKFTNQSVDVTLPADIDNQSGNVWIRITTTGDASGKNNRASTAIDDFNLTWDEASSNSTTWDGTAWSNGTPDLTKEVILHATPTESFSAKKLTVERDMIIPAGITITVENEVVNQNDVTFRFRHGAYLIQKNNSAVNVGPAMFDRSSAPIYRLENLMWSSPVINQNIFEISPNTLTNRFARFLESTNDWTENVTAADNFKAGELISFRAPNNYNNYGEGEAQVFDSSFRGQLFNGEVTIPVTKASKGNNAVGNPYASPLSLDALIAANTSVGINSVYVWTHSKPIVDGAYQGSNWAIYNGTGWNDNSVTSQNIDIAQGFIVKVANAGNLVLNNAMRTSANGPVYYKEQKDRYWLSLSNNQGKINSSLIGYVNGSTNKFDQNFDAQPFDNKAEGLYSVLNNDLFVIQGRGDFNNEDSFDLTFNVKKAGTYQINLEKFEGVFENQNIYLVDKKLDKAFNLNELKSYSFDTEAGEINDRFSINYQNKTLSTNDLSKKGLVVYAQNKQITISSKESIKSIKLVDISGRQLQNIQNINTKNYVINLNVNPQVVVVVVENTNGTIESRKVILK
ncbi:MULTISPECIES: hypothetical protein [unclassified Empedobacter]|uniref:hypothetical protein n=1 Tax=unclassified Empedobacter TaxID=2643773 RepID=UPI0025BDD0A1|nr:MULTISPECIES: hypothetical protein [unclassified Empedobacter]